MMKPLPFQLPALQTILLSIFLVVPSLQTINAEPATKPQAIVDLESFNTTISMQVRGDFNENKTHTRISGPNGFLANSTGGTNIDLSNFGEMEDGVYHYEITSPTGKTRTLAKNRLDNGRGNKEKNTVIISEIQSGFFRVKNGAIVTPKNEIEEK